MPWGGKKGKKGKSARAAAKMTSARFKSILSERHLARFIAELELSDHDVYGFFELFCLIDKDSSGSIGSCAPLDHRTAPSHLAYSTRPPALPPARPPPTFVQPHRAGRILRLFGP